MSEKGAGCGCTCAVYGQTELARALDQAEQRGRAAERMVAALIWNAGGSVFLRDAALVTLKPDDEISQWYDMEARGTRLEIRAALSPPPPEGA
jgi:hypothetical protein